MHATVFSSSSTKTSLASSSRLVTLSTFGRSTEMFCIISDLIPKENGHNYWTQNAQQQSNTDSIIFRSTTQKTNRYQFIETDVFRYWQALPRNGDGVLVLRDHALLGAGNLLGPRLPPLLLDCDGRERHLVRKDARRLDDGHDYFPLDGRCSEVRPREALPRPQRPQAPALHPGCVLPWHDRTWRQRDASGQHVVDAASHRRWTPRVEPPGRRRSRGEGESCVIVSLAKLRRNIYLEVAFFEIL